MTPQAEAELRNDLATMEAKLAVGEAQARVLSRRIAELRVILDAEEPAKSPRLHVV